MFTILSTSTSIEGVFSPPVGPRPLGRPLVFRVVEDEPCFPLFSLRERPSFFTLLVSLRLNTKQSLCVSPASTVRQPGWRTGPPIQGPNDLTVLTLSPRLAARNLRSRGRIFATEMLL
eukprot:1189349-Prorocentrum_minimum.AAC.1